MYLFFKTESNFLPGLVQYFTLMDTPLCDGVCVSDPLACDVAFTVKHRLNSGLKIIKLHSAFFSYRRTFQSEETLNKSPDRARHELTYSILHKYMRIREAGVRKSKTSGSTGYTWLWVTVHACMLLPLKRLFQRPLLDMYNILDCFNRQHKRVCI